VRLLRILESTTPLDLAYPHPNRNEEDLQRLSGDESGEADTTPPTASVTIIDVNTGSNIGRVWESALPQGSGGGSASTSGQISVTATDGINTITIDGKDFPLGLLAAGQQIPVGKGVLTIDSVTVNAGGISAIIEYTYAITDSQTHEQSTGNDEEVSEEIVISVRGNNGSEAIGDVTITIVDDVPVADDDLNNVVTEDAAVNVVEGNVLDNDTESADGHANATAPVAWNVTAAQKAAIEQYGTLTLNDDGTWKFELDNTLQAVQALDSTDRFDFTFNYTIEDADGDKDDANLVITIQGVTDGPPSVVVDPDPNNAVFGGHNSVTGASGATVSGTVTVAAEAGITSVTIAGVEVVAGVTYPVTITSGAYGTLTITGFDVATGKISYEYTETGGAQQHNATNDNIFDTYTVVLTDGAGKTDDGSLIVHILDTDPVAHPDTPEIDEDTKTLDGNVLTNDDNGADEPVTVVGVAPGDTGSTVTGNVGTYIDGAYGEIIINANGYYFYRLKTNEVQWLGNGDKVEDTFTYTIQDADGDTSTTTITITIHGTNDAPRLNTITKGIWEDTTATGNVLDPSVASDAEGDALSVTTFTVNGVTHNAGATVVEVFDAAGNKIGDLTFAATGVYTFKPINDWNGNVPRIHYTVTDGTDTSDSYVDIVVLPVNDAPESEDASANITEGNTYTFGLNDFAFTDPIDAQYEGAHEMKAVTIDSLPGGGTLRLDGVEVTATMIAAGLSVSKDDLQAGKLTFQAHENPGENAEFAFKFRVQDDGGRQRLRHPHRRRGQRRADRRPGRRLHDHQGQELQHRHRAGYLRIYER